MGCEMSEGLRCLRPRELVGSGQMASLNSPVSTAGSLQENLGLVQSGLIPTRSSDLDHADGCPLGVLQLDAEQRSAVTR